MIINKINKFIAKGEAPDAICLTLKGGKISIKEDCPSLTNNSDVIQNPRKVTVEP